MESCRGSGDTIGVLMDLGSLHWWLWDYVGILGLNPGRGMWWWWQRRVDLGSMVVMEEVDDLASSIPRAVIRGLFVVNVLPSIMYWAPHDEIAPIIFL